MVEFQYKNKNSLDFDIKILKSNHYKFPKRKIEQISVPGRTGDLIIDEKCTENFEVTLECLIVNENVDGALEAINDWLISNNYEDILFNDGISLKGYFLDLDIIEKTNSKTRIFALIFTCYKEIK